MVKKTPAIWETWVRSLGSIPGSGRSPGEGKGYPLQYSGLENSMDYTGKELDTTERLKHSTAQPVMLKSIEKCILNFSASPSLVPFQNCHVVPRNNLIKI